MELLDRNYQRQLLQALADVYPNGLPASGLPGVEDGNRLSVNAAYLGEHDLMSTKLYQLDGVITVQFARITAKGMDFLADDGGLGAILGVVTVKLHEETLKQLIAEKIQRSDLSAPDKKRFLDQLRELPGETTKHLVLKLVDAGLQNWPQALQLLQSALPG